MKFVYKLEPLSALAATKNPRMYDHDPGPGSHASAQIHAEVADQMLRTFAGGDGFLHEHVLALLNERGAEGWLFCGEINEAWLVFVKETE